jgi:GINS complex subunit 4
MRKGTLNQPRFQEIVSKCHRNSFLNSIPEAYQSLTDQHMVRKPNLDDAVFCRVVSDIGDVQSNNEFVQMKKGDVFLERYSFVQMFLQEQRVELI